MDIVESISESVVLPTGCTTMNVSIHKDNYGTLILEETLPPQFTPRSNHYSTKTIWFREDIVKCNIKLLKIDRVEQLGDLLTK